MSMFSLYSGGWDMSGLRIYAEDTCIRMLEWSWMCMTVIRTISENVLQLQRVTTHQDVKYN